MSGLRYSRCLFEFWGKPTVIDDQAILDAFNAIADCKGWKPLHTPRNLAAAISVEAAELLELHQWDMDDADMQAERRERAAAELADIFMYLLAYCDSSGIDLKDAVAQKLVENRQRFLSD